MSITNKLNQIKNAIYGKEVRGAIHDAIKQVYDDATVNHDNANMEVKMARGTHNTLNDRLNKTDEIQAQTNARLSQKLDQDGILSMANMGQDIKEAMTGGSVAVVGKNTVLTENIVDNQVTPEKTSFIKVSKNLFNKETAVLNGYYDGSGEFVTNTNWASSDFIKVIPGQTYSSNANGTSIVFYDVNKKAITKLAGDSWSRNFTVPNNEVITYLTLPINLSITPIDKVMLVKGNQLPTTYMPYYCILSDEIELPSKATEQFLNENDIEISVGKNLFDKNKVKFGYEVYGDGSIKVSENSATTDYIEVSGEFLSISGLFTYTGMDRYYCFLNEKKEALVEHVGKIPTNTTNITLNIPKSSKYFIMSVFQRKTGSQEIKLDHIQIELNRIPSTFEEHCVFVNSLKGYPINVKQQSASCSLPTEGLTALIFGDSITQTATVSDDGSEYTEGTRSNWPKFSKEKLKLKNMWNYAQSGGNWCDFETDTIRQKLSHQITTAINNNRKADFIVVSLGTNDIGNARVLGSYEGAMSKTLETLDRTIFYEAVRWAMLTLKSEYKGIPCFVALPIQRATDDMVDNEYIEAIKKMAKRYNFIVINATEESGILKDFETGNNHLYLSDGLHPNEDGQLLMSKLYNSYIINYFNNGF